MEMFGTLPAQSHSLRHEYAHLAGAARLGIPPNPADSENADHKPLAAGSATYRIAKG